MTAEALSWWLCSQILQNILRPGAAAESMQKIHVYFSNPPQSATMVNLNTKSKCWPLANPYIQQPKDKVFGYLKLISKTLKSFGDISEPTHHIQGKYKLTKIPKEAPRKWHVSLKSLCNPIISRSKMQA